MGISEEIEDAKITAEKTKISRLKRRKIDQNTCDQLLRYKTVKLVNTTEYICNFSILAFDRISLRLPQQWFTVAAAKPQEAISRFKRSNCFNP